MNLLKLGFLVLVLFYSISAFGVISKEVNIQGVLTTSDGNFVNGDVNLISRIYNASSGGSVVYVDTNAVTASNGYFSTVLGDANTLDVNFLQDFWLTLQVKLTSASSFDAEMSPRVKLRAAPQSIGSDKAFDLNVVNSIVGNDSLVRVGSSSARTDLNVSRDLNSTRLFTSVLFPLDLSVLNVGSSSVRADLNVSRDLNATRLFTSAVFPLDLTTLNIGSSTFRSDLNVSRDLNASRLFSSVLFPLNLSVLFVGSLAVPVDLNVTGDLNVAGDVNFAGGVSAVGFFGSGAGLTSLPSSDINNTVIRPLILTIGANSALLWSGLSSGDLNLTGRIYGGIDNLVQIGSSTVQNDLNVSRDLNSTRHFNLGTMILGSALNSGLSDGDINTSGSVRVNTDLNINAQTDNRGIWIDGNIMIKRNSATWMTCYPLSATDNNTAIVCSPA